MARSKSKSVTKRTTTKKRGPGRPKKRTTKKTVSRSSSTCPKGKIRSPKSSKCVTFRAFSEKELKQFARLLGQSARGKRSDIEKRIMSVINPSTFDKLYDNLEKQRRRSLKARRSYQERGGIAKKPVAPKKTIYDWANMSFSNGTQGSNSSLSSFVGTAAPMTVSKSVSTNSFTAPPAPPAPKASPPPKTGLFGGLFSGLFGPAPKAPPAPPATKSMSSFSLPSSLGGQSSSVVYVEYDPEYADEDKYQYSMPSYGYDDSLEYDDEYPMPTRSPKKDWRELVRAGFFNEPSMSQSSEKTTVGKILKNLEYLNKQADREKYEGSRIRDMLVKKPVASPVQEGLLDPLDLGSEEFSFEDVIVDDSSSDGGDESSLLIDFSSPSAFEVPDRQTTPKQHALFLQILRLEKLKGGITQICRYLQAGDKSPETQVEAKNLIAEILTEIPVSSSLKKGASDEVILENCSTLELALKKAIRVVKVELFEKELLDFSGPPAF